MGFEFVNHNAGITDDSRRRIRRQAAKGHNAGRTVARIPQTRRTMHSRPGDLLEKGGIGCRTHFSEFPKAGADTAPMKRVGDSFGCMAHPSYLTSQARRVIQRVLWIMTNPYCRFTLQRALSPQSTAPATWWVQMMFIDEAYYHAIAAACLVAFNNASVAPEQHPTDVYRHCDQMLHLLKVKLASNEAISDATIATVIMASMYERYQHSYAAGAAHLDGLQRMTELRGGIRKLASHIPPLAYKMFRSDLEYALHSGTRTRFDLSDVLFAIDHGASLQSLAGTGVENIGRGLQGQSRPRELGASLQVLLGEVMALAKVLNDADAGRRPRLDLHALHHAFLATGYRLTEIRPLGDLPSSNIADDVLYAGLACTVAMLLPGLDGKAAQLPLMAGFIRSFWDDGSLYFSGDEQLQATLLWVIFAAEAAAIFTDAAERDWMCHRAKESIDALRLDSWQAARHVLDRFPWVHCLQDDAGLALWVGVEGKPC